MRHCFYCFLLLTLPFSLFGQKFGYVDTNYILSKIPEYKAAQEEINKLSQAWEQEVLGLYQQIQKSTDELQAEKVLLTPEIFDERQKDIEQKRIEAKEYQKKIFGFEGLLFLKQKELIAPIQDKVFDAVEKMAKQQRLQIVFDKSGDLVMIYTDPIHDYTDYVLDELGLGDEEDVAR